MAKQTRSKKAENVGKGKVTPVQVAFIVDRYLSDNNFNETRSIFRKEASSLISKTNVKEAPKSLLSLDSILDEYIRLKEQKVLLDQEKLQVEQEKSRVEMLLQGMQCVMQTYNNSSRIISPPTKLKSMDLVPQLNPASASPSGHPTNVTPTMMQVPRLPNVAMESTNFSTPSTANFSTASTSLPSQNKRKGSRVASDAPTTTKRQCRQVTRKTPSAAGSKTPFQANNTNSTPCLITQKISSVQSTSQTNSAVSCLVGAPAVHESSVAKSLFKQSTPPLQSGSPSPKTPPQESTPQVDHSISPLENQSHINSTCNNTPVDRTPSNRAVISSSTKTVMVSPSKQLTCYSMERSHYFSSPSKSQLKRLGTTRDHVKGRLDFGASDVPTTSDQTMPADIPTSGSSDDDIFDMELPNFDMFGPDFSLSEFLIDMDLDCMQGTDQGSDMLSGSSPEGDCVNSEANQSFTELLSSATEILCEKDMNISGQDSLTSVRTMTKCVTITSPVKSRSPSKDQENCQTRN